MKQCHVVTVKEIKTKNYTVALLQFGDDDFDIYVEHLGHRCYTGKMTYLNTALEAFDNVLIQVQGN